MQRILLSIAALAASVLAVSCGGSGGGASNASNSTGAGSQFQQIAQCNASQPQSLLPVPTTGNQVPAMVDFGPCAYGVMPGSAAGTAPTLFIVGSVNAPFTSVTICVPGSTTCQTIDHVLVDTGSYGLRVMSSVLNANMVLPAISSTDTGGGPLIECVQFADGYSWGSVRGADVRMAGEVATGISPVGGIPIQVIGDASAYTVPSTCTSTTPGGTTLTALNDVIAFGANAVLGVGFFNQDCGTGCTTQLSNFYYRCPTTNGCTESRAALNQQLTNPVYAFSTDNQGVVLTMPPLADGTGTVNPQGTLVFGVNTNTNNAASSTAGLNVYQASSQGNFFSTLTGSTGYTVSTTTTYSNSFIDSGSNALYLPGTTIPSDPTAGWFIPTSPSTIIQVSATQQGSNALGTAGIGHTNSLTFDVANVNTVFKFNTVNITDTAYNGLAAPASTGSISTGGVDWGMPFFYGKSIYAVLENQTQVVNAVPATGPFWAF